MTIPEERLRALVYARDLLRDILDPEVYYRLPVDVRKRAAMVLRHYPMTHELAELPGALPKLFGSVHLCDEALRPGPSGV